MKLNLILLVLLFSFGPAYSQSLLKKAKEKVNAGNKILRDIKGNGAQEQNDNRSTQEQGEYDADGNNSSGRTGRPTNTKGTKLSTNSVDVAQEITNAENNLAKKDYAQTRNSIQQAILGIEIALAYKILETIPSQIDELKSDSQNDHVAASGAGYNGLTINRQYNAPYKEDDNDSEGERFMEFSLVNSSLFASGVTQYIANPVYSSDDEGDKKILQYKGINSLLEYNEYEGYKLSVPLGQNTIIQFACVNFGDENEVVKAADAFDLEKIKNYLGEK